MFRNNSNLSIRNIFLVFLILALFLPYYFFDPLGSLLTNSGRKTNIDFCNRTKEFKFIL